jgi:hypothetical protein
MFQIFEYTFVKNRKFLMLFGEKLGKGEKTISRKLEEG